MNCGEFSRKQPDSKDDFPNTWILINLLIIIYIPINIKITKARIILTLIISSQMQKSEIKQYKPGIYRD